MSDVGLEEAMKEKKEAKRAVPESLEEERLKRLINAVIVSQRALLRQELKYMSKSELISIIAHEKVAKEFIICRYNALIEQLKNKANEKKENE
jgi:hypothetical protein